VKVWRSALGIIPNQTITEGSRLAIEVGDCFEEIVAESLRVEDQPVSAAEEGSKCGIGFSGASGLFREGMRVFLVT
jgi:hypothetical protein